MRKKMKYFVFSLFMLFGFALNVNAESLPAPDENKTITLDRDYVIDTNNFNPTKDVRVLDLNNHTLTVNGTLGIELPFELKNGTIVRGESLTTGAVIRIKPIEEGTVTIKNVVIDGSQIEMTSGYSQGIYVAENGSVVLDNVKLKNNYVNGNVFGAALFASAAKSVTIKNSEIYGNVTIGTSAGGSGAAIHVRNCDDVKIINTKIYENLSSNVGNVYIENVKNFVFDKDSIVKNNVANAAAGIRVYNTNATIAGTIEGNTAHSDNGGGLYTHFLDDTYKDYVVTITETAKIINNTSACAGGGLYVNAYKDIIPGQVIINGATFSGNKAEGMVDDSDGLYKDIGGGAIAVARGQLVINDIKMSNNTASINLGNSILVSHANGNVGNGGKLVINGGTFDNSIDLGVGSILVTGGSFKQDMSDYVDSKYVSVKTSNGYEVVENKVLASDEVIFENSEAMDNGYELVITDASGLLKDATIDKNIKAVISKKHKDSKDVKVLALYDIAVSDGTNEVEMKDGKYKISVNLDEKLLKYNTYAAVYVDENGNVSYIPASLDGNKVTFEVSHLSTYGIVGYNIPNPATNTNVEIIISMVLVLLMLVGVGFSMKKQQMNA